MSKLKKYTQFINEDLEEFKTEIEDKLNQQTTNDIKANDKKIDPKKDDNKSLQNIEQSIKKTIEDLSKQKEEIKKKLDYMEKTLSDPNIVTDINKKKTAEQDKVKLQVEMDKFDKLLKAAVQQQKDLTTKEK